MCPHRYTATVTFCTSDVASCNTHYPLPIAYHSVYVALEFLVPSDVQETVFVFVRTSDRRYMLCILCQSDTCCVDAQPS